MASIKQIKLPSNVTYGISGKGATVTDSDPGVNSNLSEGQMIAVILPVVTSLNITTAPTKTTYSVGDELDLTGMVVTATYEGGSTEVVTSECTFVPADGTVLSSGVTKVVVRYNGATTAQNITVDNKIIYGVEWDGTSTTSWTRTNKAVGFTDPNPYYYGMSGSPSSPFDNISPWKDIQIVEDSSAGTLVEIPKFYYKLTQSGTNGLKIQISPEQYEGFKCSPAHMDRGDNVGERDYIYVGRYHCGSTAYKSVTGQTPVVNITRSTARLSIGNLGTNVWQWDYATRFTIWLLYLVEFADWNSQANIGYGCGDGNAISSMGYTDSMPYHTGTTQSSRTTYGYGTQYRYIEGLWDNVEDWIDGQYNNANGINIILNPANFSDSSNGTTIGVPVGGYPSAFTISDLSGLFPTFCASENNGSHVSYTCDWWKFSSAEPCYHFGGCYIQTTAAGLFCAYSDTASSTNNKVGCRLMVLPSNRLTSQSV